jgi:hypothetical protein
MKLRGVKELWPEGRRQARYNKGLLLLQRVEIHAYLSDTSCLTTMNPPPAYIVLGT